MPQSVLKPGEFRVAQLTPNTEMPFQIEPDADARAVLAAQLSLVALPKLRFAGRLSPIGAHGWQLQAQLGASVVQSCVVSLEPVKTRIDEPVSRRFVPDFEPNEHETGSETEMSDDTDTERLRPIISAHDVMIEALSLALPAYPRKDGAELGEATFAEGDAVPLRDADLKPFAGLAALKEKLEDPGD